MAVASDPKQNMAQAMAAINTPEHAGRLLVQKILASAAKQQSKNGADGPIKIPLKATVAIGDPFGPNGGGVGGECIVISLPGATVTICPEQ